MMRELSPQATEGEKTLQFSYNDIIRDPQDPGMRRSTTCTVRQDREGRVTDPPLQMEIGTVGRGLAPAGGFAEQNHIAHCVGDGSLRHG